MFPMSENHLYQAHFQLRNAGDHEAKGHFGKALHSIELATKHFGEVLKMTSSPVIKTAIELQIDGCDRYGRILRHNDRLFTGYLDKLRKMDLNAQSEEGIKAVASAFPPMEENVTFDSVKEIGLDVIMASQNMEKIFDDVLLKEKVETPSSSLKTDSNELFVKIEKLKNYNTSNIDNLRMMLMYLGRLQVENSCLKSRAQEFTKLDGAQTGSDSTCSPFVFSPQTESSPTHSSVPDLPPLAPIDIPNLQLDISKKE